MQFISARTAAPATRAINALGRCGRAGGERHDLTKRAISDRKATLRRQALSGRCAPRAAGAIVAVEPARVPTARRSRRRPELVVCGPSGWMVRCENEVGPSRKDQFLLKNNKPPPQQSLVIIQLSADEATGRPHRAETSARGEVPPVPRVDTPAGDEQQVTERVNTFVAVG